MISTTMSKGSIAEYKYALFGKDLYSSTGGPQSAGSHTHSYSGTTGGSSSTNTGASSAASTGSTGKSTPITINPKHRNMHC